MGNFWNVGVPSIITSALGTAGEQRKRADELAEREALNRYRAETLGLDRLKLAESTRQHDLQYGPVTIDVPGIGKITGEKWAIPAMIQAASAREKDISPEEVTALSGYRERALMPPGGTINRGGVPWDPALEAEAAKTAMGRTQILPRSTEGISPMTVDLPQTNVPRQSFEKIMTEAGQQRKEQDQERKQTLQRMATARYRQLYSVARDKNTPHFLADAFAISQATKEFGIAPEREAFVAAPTERQPKMGSFTDEAGNLNIYGHDEQGNLLFKKPLGKARTNEPRFNLGQFRADLAQRSQGLQVQDPQVQRMSPAQALKTLRELGRSDFLTNVFTGGLGGGPAAGAPGKTADQQADEFLQGLE